MHGFTSSDKAPAVCPDPRRSGYRSQTSIVLAVALILRLLVVWAVLVKYPRTWFFSRGLEMGLLAKSVLAGEGLASPFGVHTGPTAFIAPAYPLFVAGLFRIFGTETTASLAIILLLHVAANLLTVWLILFVARKLSGLRAAWIAGLFWACSLPLLWMPTIFWDTCLSACILLASIAAALHWRGRFDTRLALLAGAACAAAGLLNPALLPSLAAIVIWLALQSTLAPKTRLLNLTLAAVTFALLFSPWPIRNARVFHAFIPLRTTVGFELWMGNRPGATGFLDESIFPMYNQAELASYKAQGEVAYTQGKSRLAKSYIAAHPGTFVAMSARRILRFWTGTGNRNGSLLFALHACLASVLGLAGLWLLVRTNQARTALLFAGPLLLFPFPYYITHAEFRYRLVIDPVMTVLAAFAIAWLSGERAPASRLYRPLASQHEVVLA